MRGALLVGLGVAGGLAGAGAQPTPAVEYAVVLWNVAKRSPQVVLRGDTQPVTAVMWAPDGRSVATGSREGVSLWNARTGERQAVLEGASAPLHWNPKQNVLATGGAGGGKSRVLVWDTATGRKTQEVLLPSEAAETSVAGLEWSPSGRKLAIGLGDGSPSSSGMPRPAARFSPCQVVLRLLPGVRMKAPWLRPTAGKEFWSGL